MPRFGGMTPFPNRFGGPGPNGIRIKVILDSLNRQRGNAYDTSVWSSNVYAENMATARMLAGIWSANQRLANQWDPQRMTSNLSRWEKILGLAPAPSDTTKTRQTRVQAVFAQTGQVGFTSYLSTRVSGLLGVFYVALEFISYANAVINVPNGSYPWGTVNAGSPWYSTTAHILVRVQKPTGYSDADFNTAVGKLAPAMESLLPAWASWDWYRAPSIGAPVVVSGGPSAGGFYFDEQNFDILVFDV
jgi:uncharacterized protein YmfQ (DUF2313 family)